MTRCAYLFDNKVKILAAPLYLIADSVELDLGTLLQARFDRDFKDLVGLDSLSGLIVSLALNLHLLGHTVEELFKR